MLRQIPRLSTCFVSTVIALIWMVFWGPLLTLNEAEAMPKRPGEEAGNLLPNASFEESEGGMPVYWKTANWGGKASLSLAGTGRTGGHSLEIRSEEGADAAWQIAVPVELRSTYRLSAWIKTEHVEPKSGRGALLNIHNMQPHASAVITGTRDWTRVEIVFENDVTDVLVINCLFGGWGLASGTAWYDDLRLEQLSHREWKPAVAIDASKTGELISKYIYGQFIEHLGRCIYGGIWAEMLEDRKFYYAVGAEESPWEVVGPRDIVTMDEEDSFVGEQTPRVTLPGEVQGAGIIQKGLGLVAGRGYVGRIWLAGDPAAAPVEISLVWGDGPDARQTVKVEGLTPAFCKTPLWFTAGAGTEDGRLEIISRGTEGRTLRIGTVSLMPADNLCGMRADTLLLLKELDSPVYRWPGGNFVSGYDWKDGIGETDRRPPRKNPAWTGVEHNDFGVNEFMTFCRVLGTEPYIAVNSGLGGVESAVEELQYVNGGPDTEMGKLRAKHGHAEPYGVRFFGIGNEMYGGWQLGHVPLAEYIKRHQQFYHALHAADPSITLVAVGAVGPWSEGMMAHCADQMELVSEHFYKGMQPGLAGHVLQIPDAVRQIAEAHRKYRKEIPALAGKDIRVALDEWNYWYGPHVFGELGTRYHLKDALGIAAGLNEYIRNSDIYFMANYAQTVNVIGCIKTSKTAASFATTGLALKLYRAHFGSIPVAVETERPLDIAAAWTFDRRTLTVAIVNPTLNPLEIPATIQGARFTGHGRRYEIAGGDPNAYNEPGQEPHVTIVETTVTGFGDTFAVAPCSVTLFVLEVE
ncbi:MAG: alpha-L-arabinofuranosidase C-terminal domain-containing protein [Planctomycetota bacterium]